MTTYSITGPDGKTYSLDGPPGKSRDEVIQEIQRQQSKRAAPQEDETPGWLPEMGKAAVRGMISDPLGLLGELASFKHLREEPQWLTEIKKERAAKGENVPNPMPFLSPASSPYEERLAKGMGAEADPNESGMQQIVGAGIESAVNPINWPGGGLSTLPKTTVKAMGPLAKFAAGPAGRVVAGGIAGVTGETLGQLGDQFNPQLGNVGRAVGGFAGGYGAGALERGLGNREGAAKLHGAEELERRSKQAYAELDANPVQVTPQHIQDLHRDIVSDVDQAGYAPVTAPATFALIRRQLRPGQAWTGDTTDLMGLHSKLGAIGPTGRGGVSDVAAAQIARERIREWLFDNMPPGTEGRFRKALGNWAAKSKIEDVQKALDIAINRAEMSGTNKNAINTMRQEISKILDLRNEKRSRGYSEEAKQQMEKIISGTFLENRLRAIGKAIPYSSGLALIMSLSQAKLSWPFIAAAGGTYGARKLGDILTRQQIGKLVQILQEQAPANKGQRARNLNIANKIRGVPFAAGVRGLGEAEMRHPPSLSDALEFAPAPRRHANDRP